MQPLTPLPTTGSSEITREVNTENKTPIGTAKVPMRRPNGVHNNWWEFILYEKGGTEGWDGDHEENGGGWNGKGYGGADRWDDEALGWP